MNLKITGSQSGELEADQPKFRQACLMILLGIVIAFIGVFSAIYFDLLIGLLVVTASLVVAFWGLSIALRSEILSIYPRFNRIYRQYSYRKPQQQWDTDFISGIEARIIQDPNGKSKVAVFLKFKIQSEQQVLTEVGESIPQNCVKYMNMLLEHKEVPKGTYRD
ncbi:MAG: hypothetical protein LUQ65_00100 [Candidatus Helarchaeota archaeon]|nr:hypothetical protein [Candidatus Helarchaeota archaeon]